MTFTDNQMEKSSKWRKWAEKVRLYCHQALAKVVNKQSYEA